MTLRFIRLHAAMYSVYSVYSVSVGKRGWSRCRQCSALLFMLFVHGLVFVIKIPSLLVIPRPLSSNFSWYVLRYLFRSLNLQLWLKMNMNTRIVIMFEI